MIDLSTTYMGLALKNPLVAASSGLTGTIEGIKNLEKKGIAAVVLKSLFEEEIYLDTREQLAEAKSDSLIYSGMSETLDYLDVHIREDHLKAYLNLISQAKEECRIPVIASISCVSQLDWTNFAQRIEHAGADALELNLFLNPADFENKEFEKAYFLIIEKVLEKISIPLSIKISSYFTRLGLTVKALSETGIKSIVLFNRFYAPDIDLEKISLTPGSIYTSPGELHETLRWVAILSGKVSCELAATRGIHDGEDLAKVLLAGASVAQVASTLYKNGPDKIARMLSFLESWMERSDFARIEQFRGRIAEEYEENPAAFERMQFMKHFSEIR